MIDWSKHFKYEDGNLISKYTNKPMCNYDKEGYIRVRRDGKEYRAHRVIWEILKGPIPDGMLIDHINGNTRDNRIENLRLATRQQNNINRVKSGQSTLPKGVVKVGARYRARITRNSKTISIGTYDTPEEAGNAYNAYAEELDGEFFKK